MTYEISAVRQDPDFSSFSASAVAGCIGAVIDGLTAVHDLASRFGLNSWDNRSTQHVILPDFQPQYRCNHRVAIEDTARPIGPAQALKSVG